jgi:hypothetical protein
MVPTTKCRSDAGSSISSTPGLYGCRPLKRGHSIPGRFITNRFEIGCCTLAGNEAQLHQLARGVVDEDQQRAGLAALLERAMIAAVDLDQFAVALTPQSRLVEGSSLRTRKP